MPHKKLYSIAILFSSLIGMSNCKPPSKSTTKSIVGTNTWIDANSANTKELAAKYQTNVVDLQINNQTIGIGTVISTEKKLLLTNAHVAITFKFCKLFSTTSNACGNFKGINNSAELTLKSIEILDKNLDFAIIKYDINRQNAPFVPVKFDDFHNSSDIYYQSFVQNSPVVGKGNIVGEDLIRKEKPSFFHNINTIKGMSGSPIFANSGAMVGIHWGSKTDNLANQAIPISVLANKYPEWFGKITLPPTKQSAQSSPILDNNLTCNKPTNAPKVKPTPFKSICSMDGINGKYLESNTCFIVTSSNTIKKIAQNSGVAYNENGIYLVKNSKGNTIIIDADLDYILKENNEVFFELIGVILMDVTKYIPSVFNEVKSEYSNRKQVELNRYREEKAAKAVINAPDLESKKIAEEKLEACTWERENSEAKSLTVPITEIKIEDGDIIRTKINESNSSSASSTISLPQEQEAKERQEEHDREMIWRAVDL